jgi:mannitol/fructose-specific phosphotransferase system IIA component (Ntr-type)
MRLELFNERLIELDVEVKTAEEAIRKAGSLLVSEGKVEKRYIDEMVRGFQEIGPYIVLAPSIAIPHARPEHGVLEQGISLIRLKNPIVFNHPKNDPVLLVCAICGVDNTSHISMLQSLASVLGDKSKLEIIMSSQDKQEILSIIN